MNKLILTLAAMLLLPLAALADHDHEHGKGKGPMMGGPMKEPTKEERAKMADMHTKMAACLKTDKPMGDCHKEMMDSCKAGGKEATCPMMGMMGHHHDHDHDDGKNSKDSKDSHAE